MKNNFLFLIGIGIFSFFILFIASTTWIEMAVEENCKEAVSVYGGDCVEALSAEVTDEQASFHDRNDATWSLGQLGDKRALPVLESLQNGDETQTKYNTQLSQYELKKAINLLKSGFNLTRPFRW